MENPVGNAMGTGWGWEFHSHGNPANSILCYKEHHLQRVYGYECCQNLQLRSGVSEFITAF